MFVAKSCSNRTGVALGEESDRDTSHQMTPRNAPVIFGDRMNLRRIGVFPARSNYRSALSLFTLLGALPSACVYDSADRCGPHQVMYQDLRCVCDAQSGLTDTGCVPCGTDEVPGEKGCICKSGYTKPATGGVCAPTPVGLGTACEVSTDCNDAKFDHCETGTEGKGYCTDKGCASSADCTGGYACDALVTPSVCRRPPLGLSMSCSSNADCAGTEATYCDTFMSHSCMVQGCSSMPDNCFSGWVCCDLSAVGIAQPVCVQQGACIK